MSGLPSLLAGLSVLALVWGGPLLSGWRNSFAAHMVAHMGVVAIAAPLLSIGILKWTDRGGRDRAAAFPAAAPVVASLAELVVVWAWHAPALRALAERSTLATAVEQAMFLAAGLALWITALAGRTPQQAAAGAFALLLTSIHMTLLGALLGLAPRALYGAGEVTCFGVVLSAGQDQAAGGVVMLMIGAAVYLAGGLALLARMLDRPEGSAAR